ncbi:MAG: cellobiose 2-epimerase [Aureliella sp.]
MRCLILPCVVSLLLLRPLLADDSVVKQAEQCREILINSLVDFYLPHSVDKEFGGYLEVLDANGNFTGGEKFLTLQARQVWFCSTLARSGIRKEASLAAAKTGYEFLQLYFRDPENGGYFTKTSQDGTPTDSRKHAYPNAFVIYALVEYHRAAGDASALAEALRLFATLEKHCYDSTNGGYREFFYADWQPITDPSESGYVGAINTKTYNTHLHLLEAFTQLLLETNDARVAARLGELIDINTLTVRHSRLPCNIDGWSNDWTMIRSPKNLRASYGHDVECSWLVLDAAAALKRPARVYRSWATGICDHSIKFGYDQIHGGFYYTGPLGKPSDDTKKEWWTQAEAMVAMLRLHQLTGESRYKKLFDETFTFVLEHQIAEQGGWWATVNADGTLRDRSVRTSMWQGAYHNARALLMCESMLRKISQD